MGTFFSQKPFTFSVNLKQSSQLLLQICRLDLCFVNKNRLHFCGGGWTCFTGSDRLWILTHGCNLYICFARLSFIIHLPAKLRYLLTHHGTLRCVYEDLDLIFCFCEDRIVMGDQSILGENIGMSEYFCLGWWWKAYHCVINVV